MGGDICSFEAVWETPFFEGVIYDIGNWSDKDVCALFN